MTPFDIWYREKGKTAAQIARAGQDYLNAVSRVGADAAERFIRLSAQTRYAYERSGSELADGFAMLNRLIESGDILYRPRTRWNRHDPDRASGETWWLVRPHDDYVNFIISLNEASAVRCVHRYDVCRCLRTGVTDIRHTKTRVLIRQPWRYNV